MITEKQFRKEYSRCNKCKVPVCELHCPAGVCIPALLQFYEYGLDKAIEYAYKINPFQEICGYLCSDKYCISSCVKNNTDGFPINIRTIHKYLGEHFCLDYDKLITNDYPNKSVIVIGSGVTGLTIAWLLANLGIKVDIFEQSLTEIGGKLNLIPETRLPKDVLERTLAIIKNHPNITITNNLSITDIEAFKQEQSIPVFEAIGTPFRKNLDIEGSSLTIDYRDYLPNPNISEKDNIAIIGGGNVAVDCALISRYKGAKTTMFVRRNFFDMKIEEKYLKELFDNSVNIVNNFVPNKITLNFNDMSLCGDCFGNNVEIKGFTKIVLAIGDKDSQGKPQTIVECVAKAKEMVNEYLRDLENA